MQIRILAAKLEVDGIATTILGKPNMQGLMQVDNEVHEKPKGLDLFYTAKRLVAQLIGEMPDRP